MCEYTARIIEEPGEEFSVGKRYWQGCPTIARTRKGTVFAGWYSGGTTEPSQYNYNILIRSRDDGFTWSEPVLVVQSVPENECIAIDIQLWTAPNGSLWVFWVERKDHCRMVKPEHLATYAIVCGNPDDEKLVWSQPRFIAHGFLRCKPTVLSDGRWLLPAYDWCSDCYAWSESNDQGKTWIRRNGGRKMPTDFDEGMFYEDKQGHIHLLARSRAGCIAESLSTDGGKSWSDGAKTCITAPSSRLFVRRLPSGRLLLIHNDTEDGSRANMTARLSEDDGKTWPFKLMLDDSMSISYPDATFLDDGSILTIYDYGRETFREILCARYTEEDIMAGKLVETRFTPSYLRHIISKAPVPGDKAAYQDAMDKDKAWHKIIWWKDGNGWL